MARSAPISKKDLPHIVTIFNIFKDPATGKTSYYRNFVKNVRVMAPQTSLASSMQGQKKIYSLKVLIDTRTSQGFMELEDGTAYAKPFLLSAEWRKLDHEGRFNSWTINEGDWMGYSMGGLTTKCPAFQGGVQTESQFKAGQGNIRVISSARPMIDFDGSIHSWSVTLD